MQKQPLLFTAGQFARLHHLNKRTLHYYDDIGLFSPAHRGEQNGYRYYTDRQSAELQNILAFRELGMSIEEIMDYRKHPDAEGFLSLSGQKLVEIDAQLRRLKNLKSLLEKRRASLALCQDVYDGKIEVLRLPREFLLLTPLPDGEEADMDMEQLLAHLQAAWDHGTGRIGCGTYLALHRVCAGQFDAYDGLFTPVPCPQEGESLVERPAGDYLCGYCVGDWAKIPSLYEKMLDYAEKNGLQPEGCCYESGLNEFAISRMEDYVTQIVIYVSRERKLADEESISG